MAPEYRPIPPYIKVESMVLDIEKLRHSTDQYGPVLTVIVANTDDETHDLTFTFYRRHNGAITSQADEYISEIPAHSKKRGVFYFMGYQPRGVTWYLSCLTIDKTRYPIEEIPFFAPKARDCFVVTAVFGDPDHPVVNSFRSLRDEVLAHHKAGKMIISWYNKVGPKLAGAIEHRPILCKAARSILTPTAHLCNYIRSKNFKAQP